MGEKRKGKKTPAKAAPAARAPRAPSVAIEQRISAGSLRNVLGTVADTARVSVHDFGSLAVWGDGPEPIQVISLIG